MEGAAMVAEGIPAPLIENAALAAGMPVGPLAVLDETSLALSVAVLDQTRADAATGGEAFEPSPGQRFVERMVKELERPGRAGGGGFYDYPDGAPKQLWQGLRQFERAGEPPAVAEIAQRLLYRQSIETLRCLAERVLTSAHEANIGSILGIGFPAWTGGAVRFVASEGVGRFEANADALALRHGAGFALEPEVRRLLPGLAASDTPG
jgi:3-hydroxyacyl-CoA dehydrogenase/enoyl-CoA hydratase/3-hydroxybutyryl-CoA epimerase